MRSVSLFAVIALAITSWSGCKTAAPQRSCETTLKQWKPTLQHRLAMEVLASHAKQPFAVVPAKTAKALKPGRTPIVRLHGDVLTLSGSEVATTAALQGAAIPALREKLASALERYAKVNPGKKPQPWRLFASGSVPSAAVQSVVRTLLETFDSVPVVVRLDTKLRQPTNTDFAGRAKKAFEVGPSDPAKLLGASPKPSPLVREALHDPCPGTKAIKVPMSSPTYLDELYAAERTCGCKGFDKLTALFSVLYGDGATHAVGTVWLGKSALGADGSWTKLGKTWGEALPKLLKK